MLYKFKFLHAHCSMAGYIFAVILTSVVSVCIPTTGREHFPERCDNK